MKFETNYPYVLVHGMYGFGTGNKLNDLVPYWGMLSGNLLPYLEAEGFECYTPAVGPASSAWDRACELYAQLMGTTVDYGAVHSKKNNHKRYGRTYNKPLFEGWGRSYSGSKIKKINLFGHSFGGETIRMLAQLMADGSPDEIAGTQWDEVSDLFKGGKGDWINSITTLTSPHNGVTLIYSLENVMNGLKKFTYTFSNAVSGTFIADFYDPHTEQFSLNGVDPFGKNTKMPMNKAGQATAADGKDNIFYDLSLKGAEEMNKQIKCQKDVYYFSFPTEKTNEKMFSKNKYKVPRFSMSPMFKAFARSIGKYRFNLVDEVKIDERWLYNDGLVNTISAKAPFNEPSVEMWQADKIKKGIWHVMDVQDYDHLGIVGGLLPPVDNFKLKKLYRDHMCLINSLK